MSVLWQLDRVPLKKLACGGAKLNQIDAFSSLLIGSSNVITLVHGELLGSLRTLPWTARDQKLGGRWLA
jgi:hypothetical protein